jgi:hypothetical protein
MPRYVKQRDLYSCGPIAVANALKWAGKDISYKKHHKGFKRLCGAHNIKGVRPRNLEKALKVAGKGLFSITPVCKPKLEEIDKHLSGNGCIVLSYAWTERKVEENVTIVYVNGHYINILDKTSNGILYKVTNDGCYDPVKREFEISSKGTITRTELKSKLKRHLFQEKDEYEDYPLSWFLTRI